MSLTNKQKLFRQLVRYRCFISANDVALHYRYTQYLDSINHVPKQHDHTGCISLGWRMYAHACVFRDELYYNIYNSLYDNILCSDRYAYTFMSGTCWVRVTITRDEFDITFAADMFIPAQDSKFIKHIIHNNYKDEWQSLAKSP